jgi:hypothetical protein
MDATFVNPEVGSTALLHPDRGGKSWPTLCVDLQIPPWFRLCNDQELDHITAAAGTAHANTPVLTIVAS